MRSTWYKKKEKNIENEWSCKLQKGVGNVLGFFSQEIELQRNLESWNIDTYIQSMKNTKGKKGKWNSSVWNVGNVKAID